MRRSPAKTYVDYLSGPVKIKDALYMGDQIAAKDMDFIASNKVTHIINTVVNKIPNLYQRLGIQYLSVNWTQRQANIFDKKNNAVNMIFQFVQQAMQLGQSVLIHSVNGKSRAGCVIVAYLMKKYCWSVQKSIEFIISKKAEFKIKNSFLVQLQDLQKRMLQSYNLNSSWNQSKNQQQLTLINTFKNSKKSVNSQIQQTKKNRKKLSWGEKTVIGPNAKTSQILTSTSKYRQYLQNEGIKPISLKSILKNDPVKQQYNQQSMQNLEQSNNFDPANSVELKSKRRKNEIPENQNLAKSQVIGSIRGNVVNVVVNNYLTSQKTTSRYSSIPAKQKQLSKKLESRSGSRLAPYQNIISSIKSPYDSNFINRIGENTKVRKKEDRNYYKNPPNTQQRPHSVNLQQSLKNNQNRSALGNKPIPSKQQIIATSIAPKSRYAWASQRQNFTKNK